MKAIIKALPAILLIATLAGCATTAGQSAAKPENQGADPNYDASKQRAVKLTQTSRGAQMTIDARVFFDTGKAEVRGEGQTLLDRAATMLKEKTTASVLIEGHTDNTGTAQGNQRLSEQRADSVRTGLAARGVPVARMQAKGLGISQPVADNGSEDGRAQNRRVEITMLGETVDRIGGKAEEERLASGLDKFLKNADEFVRGVFDKITGGGDKK